MKTFLNRVLDHFLWALDRVRTSGGPKILTMSVLVVGLLPVAERGPLAAEEESHRRVVRVGVVFDGPPERNPEDPAHFSTRRHFEKVRVEILALTQREFDVRFPESKQLSGDWSKPRIQARLMGLLADPDVDLVLAMGYFSTLEACRQLSLPKPVVAPFGIDIDIEQLPLKDGTSGVPNLTFISHSSNATQQLKDFRELIEFQTVHVLHDPLIVDFIPDIYDHFRARASQAGFEAVPLPASSSAAEVLDLLPAAVEAVYVVPLPRMPLSEFELLLAGLKKRKLPTFSLTGRRDVRLGVLAGLSPESSPERLARRVALDVQRILLGEDAGTLPVLVDQQEHLVLNMETARAIGWSPTWMVLTQAEQLHSDELNRGRILTLAEAGEEALRRNLSLFASERGVMAGLEQVEEARSALRPQLDLTTEAIQIDEDRARGSQGNVPERVWLGSATLTQILYSDAASGNVEVERHLQKARQMEWEQIRLDTALSAVTAFLDVLRAQTTVEVQQENLRLTEANLEIARRRQELGVSGPSEVYRFESQLARDRREFNAAGRQVEAARSGLNRILHRPQNEPFVAQPPSLEDPTLLTGRGRLQPYVTKLGSFRVFGEFAVQEGLLRAPELLALDAAIEAQERVLLINRRDYWAPDITLFGDLTHEIRAEGEGAQGPPPASPLAGLESDETDWTAGITVSLPLSEGGARAARVLRAQEQLTQLKLERQAAAEAIELRIRTALYRVSSSYPAIKFNQDAAEAAKRNLDLVTDQYSSGVVSIIDLLDAQNNALQADELAANSIYNFLADLLELQRAMSSFGFLMSDAEREDWFHRVREFFHEARETPPEVGG